MKNLPPGTIAVEDLPPCRLAGDLNGSHLKKGILILDSNRQVVSVNAVFQQFHALFSTYYLVSGVQLDQTAFLNYPCNFYQSVVELLSRKHKRKQLTIDKKTGFPSSFCLDLSADVNNENYSPKFIVTVEEQVSVTDDPGIDLNDGVFRELIERSGTAYLFTDSALVIKYSNAVVAEVLGYEKQQIHGKNLFELVHTDDHTAVKNWLSKITNTPKEQSIVDFRVKNRNDNYLWMECTGQNFSKTSAIGVIVVNLKNIQVKKAVDDALVAVEQRLSQLLNNTAESFIILNSRLRIQTYNKAAQNTARYFYIHELRSGESFLDLLDKADIAEYVSLFETVFNGGKASKETFHTDRKGNKRVYDHSLRPLYDTNNEINGIFVTSTDITKRYELTAEVALQAERLKTAQEIAKLAYFEYNFQTKTYYCSDHFRKILDLPFTIKGWTDILKLERWVADNDRSTIKTKLGKLFREHKNFSQEFKFAVTGACEKVVIAFGDFEKNRLNQVVKLRITLQDITERRTAHLAVQALESKFKSLFENSIDGVIISEFGGKIVSANPSICKILGYSASQMTGFNCYELLQIDKLNLQRIFARLRQQGTFSGELTLKHKNGSLLTLEVSSVIINDASTSRFISTIIRDVTEKKKIEAEQKALTEEVLKNNQDLQQFSFITSHNLRAPVANLLSLLSLYNKEDPYDEFNQILVEKFGETTSQLNHTLNDLINILVIKSNNSIEKEKLSLTEIFVEVKKNIDNLLLQQRGRIEANFSEVDEVEYNRIHIESIFLNMLSNVIRYSSPERTPIIKIKSARLKEWVVVEFCDNGLGIDLNRYGDRMFGLYQRFHENKEGKGLGLYMIRSQVVAAGGKIEVESTPGVGTTFKIFIKYY